jgi:hypothetical protein
MHGPTGGTQGGGAVLPGSPSFNYDQRFGGIPGVPSPGGTQQDSLRNNISALGPIYNLGKPLNQFTAQQAPTSLNLNLPNYQQSLATQSGDVLSKLQGQIPQDVKNQLAQFGAERGVQTGSIGSPNSNAALMSLFGTNSLALQNQGMQQFGQQIAQTPQGQQFNPFGFLVSPQEQQAAQYQANLLNSAPVPSSAQFANLNALQSGRGAGYSGFGGAPSPMMPSSAPVYQGGQQPVGGINPPNTGGTAYSSSWGGNPFQPGDFESMYPDLADQFQTGDPSSQSPGWSGGDFTGELDFNNLFGDGGDFGG